MPKEIREKSLRFHWAFGPMEFFDKDIEKISSWATSIQILDFKLRHNEEFMTQYVTLKELNREGNDLEDEEDAENQYYKDVIHNE